MILTMNQISKMNQFKNYSVLEIKKKLITAKKEGFIFIQENISLLELEQEFELYFIYTGSKNSRKIAIPVPKNEYYCCEQIKQKIQFLKPYYERYYQDEVTDQNELFAYCIEKPFVANSYIWFYKRIDGNS